MVLTNMPFERSRLIHSRYNLMRRPESAPASKEDDENHKQSKDYAAFLKEQDRKVGPDGFLDSNKFSHTFAVKKDRERHQVSSQSARPTVLRLSTQVELDKKDHDKRLRVIEDHMWQHKQEERELKRVEGDIIKNQRLVRHSLRDFENGINKKRMTEEKKLNQGLEKYKVLQQDYVHQKYDSSQNRTQENIQYEHERKDQQRKNALKQSDLSRSYKAKRSEMELKEVEVMRLNQAFEDKMRQKEEERYKLQQELAELAIALNMESQKGRQETCDTQRERKREVTDRIQEDLTAKQTVDNKIAKSDGDTKGAEISRRKLSADLTVTKSHTAIKQRDEQRHLTDTQMRLDDNSNVQRQLNEAAFQAEMDLKSKQMQANIETESLSKTKVRSLSFSDAHNARRVHLMTSHMKQKKQKETAQQQVWEARYQKRAAQQARLQHEDSLKFFQKMVSKGEEQEQNLYSRVRNAEYSRQKQEQSVRRLQQQLQETKRKNAATLKNDILARNRNEVEIEQHLQRERADLDKVHSQREETYVRIQRQRYLLVADKQNLAVNSDEHDRLQRIAQRSRALDSY